MFDWAGAGRDVRSMRRRPGLASASGRSKAQPYLCMRAHLVFLRIFLYLCLRIFFRRFFTTDDIGAP